MQSSQLIVVLSTIIIFVLSFLLAMSLTMKYLKATGKSLLYWSMGMWAFAVGAFIEIIFAFNITGNNLLNSFYLLVVALLVEFLAMGSMQLIKSSKLKLTYNVYVVLTTLVLIYALAVSKTVYTNPSCSPTWYSGCGLVVNYVASGVPSWLVVYASSAITFVASAVLVIVAALSYMKKRNPRLLAIIVGVALVVVAGTLYIASFPVFLYYSEFAGILLLWYAFSSPKK